MYKLTLACIFSCLPPVAWCDDAPAAPAPIADSYAPDTCKPPKVHVKFGNLDEDSADLTDKVKAYEECINAYADGQRQLSKLHADAANAAIGKYNDFVKNLKELQQQQ